MRHLAVAAAGRVRESGSRAGPAGRNRRERSSGYPVAAPRYPLKNRLNLRRRSLTVRMRVSPGTRSPAARPCGLAADPRVLGVGGRRRETALTAAPPRSAAVRAGTRSLEIPLLDGFASPPAGGAVEPAFSLAASDQTSLIRFHRPLEPVADVPAASGNPCRRRKAVEGLVPHRPADSHNVSVGRRLAESRPQCVR